MMDFRKELLTLLSTRGLSRDEMLSVSLAMAKKEHAESLIHFLKANENLTVDEIFQKAGELAFGQNS
ncbi:MAG: hypothetical protein IKD18_00965 [Clostridia bacterium]|nr:hypothetical protein [Clostridia bacterium]